jgi:histidine ammonia-lyase
MGWSAARKLRRSIDGAQRVVAIELLTAARAMDMRAPLQPSVVSAAVVAKLRESVPAPGTDRYLAPEIAAAVAAVHDGSLLAAATSAVRHAGGELV